MKVLSKYCNGEYGFEHKAVKLGVFQQNFIRVLFACSRSEFTLSFFARKGAIGLLAQVVEEAVLLGQNLALTGDLPWNCQLFSFVETALDFFGLFLSAKTKENIGEVRECLRIVREAFSKGAQRKKKRSLYSMFLADLL